MTILHFISVHFITLCWCVFALFWLVSAFSVKPILERQSWAGRLTVFAFVTLTITLLLGKIPWWGINTRIWSLGTAQRMLGCVMTFMGVAVLIWSRISLGTNWSAMVNFREGQELVERGPYRFVRHPMYSGLLLMVAGTAIAMGTVSGLLSLVVCFLGHWWKLKCEEALLAKHFPDSYPQYKLRTKALIPFIL